MANCFGRFHLTKADLRFLRSLHIEPWPCELCGSSEPKDL